MPDSVAYLRTPIAIRERCNAVLSLGLEGNLEHFSVDLAAIDKVAALVVEVTREAYPDLKVPIHGRFRHFEVGGVDRIAKLREKIDDQARSVQPSDRLERARVFVDLVVPSVLLDAGAGPAWKYVEDDVTYARSEGLAVASFNMFVEGAFSSRVDQPLRADAEGLARMDVESIARGFQVSKDNPLVGLEGRVGLLRALGQALVARRDAFGEDPRIGHIVDVIAKRGDRVKAADVLAVVLDGLGSIWPGRVEVDGVNLGDVWQHPQVGLVPFHKLSQWLTYSLVEPLNEAGIAVVDLDELTGLPEYRNGGLMFDGGVIAAKHSGVTGKRHFPSDPIVVEWRALTVALLDRVADAVRARLDMQLPLANILQGGTWTAGRKLAASRGGLPPIEIESDGTVF
jgi:hypothetical protein